MAPMYSEAVDGLKNAAEDKVKPFGSEKLKSTSGPVDQRRNISL
jgi:hypothetical protein